MTVPMKTLLVGALIALAVALFTLQAAHAGGYHNLPFATLDPYAADTYDEETEFYAAPRVPELGPEIDGAVSTAHSFARDYLDTDLRDEREELEDLDD